MNWQKGLIIRRNQPLKGKTTFRIGGKAEFFSRPKNRLELIELLSWAGRRNLPVFIIGAGSNLLIKDNGVKGLVIELSSSYFKKVRSKGNCIEAGSGALLASLSKVALNKSLGGLEFLSGIPGSLGGALMMNAGCWGKDIGSLVKEIDVLDLKGNRKILSKNDAGFGYRRSLLEGHIILSAVLKLKKSSKVIIRRNIKEYILKKRSTQDLASYNAGCIFKNPEIISAGKLIDLCGLKGIRRGDAFISCKHANFILNRGNAKACDVLSLMKLIRIKVKEKFNVVLDPEIRILGE